MDSPFSMGTASVNVPKAIWRLIIHALSVAYKNASLAHKHNADNVWKVISSTQLALDLNALRIALQSISKMV